MRLPPLDEAASARWDPLREVRPHAAWSACREGRPCLKPRLTKNWNIILVSCNMKSAPWIYLKALLVIPQQTSQNIFRFVVSFKSLPGQSYQSKYAILIRQFNQAFHLFTSNAGLEEHKALGNWLRCGTDKNPPAAFYRDNSENLRNQKREKMNQKSDNSVKLIFIQHCLLEMPFQHIIIKQPAYNLYRLLCELSSLFQQVMCKL